MASFVYFIRPIGMDGPVKIGFSTLPERRLEVYLGLAPWPLEIAAVLPGGHQLERRFHSRFAPQWTHHEWFDASPDLTAAIDAIKAGTFDASTLPEATWSPMSNARRWTEGRRQNSSLYFRLHHSTGAIGIVAPEEVRAAAMQLSALDGAARDAAIALIEDFLSDPVSKGTVGDYDWDREKFARYQARRAGKKAA